MLLKESIKLSQKIAVKKSIKLFRVAWIVFKNKNNLFCNKEARLLQKFVSSGKNTKQCL